MGADAADGNVRRILLAARRCPLPQGQRAHQCAGVAQLLLLAVDLVLLRLVHLPNLRIGTALAGGLGGRRGRGCGVGKRALVRRGGARRRGRRRRVALGERGCISQKKGARQQRDASALGMSVIDLLLSDRRETARGRLRSVTPPIACRSEARGCAFRSRRRSRSSAPVRTAARRARQRRSAACWARAARCRRWSPAEPRPS